MKLNLLTIGSKTKILQQFLQHGVILFLALYILVQSSMRTPNPHPRTTIQQRFPSILGVWNGPWSDDELVWLGGNLKQYFIVYGCSWQANNWVISMPRISWTCRRFILKEIDAYPFYGITLTLKMEEGGRAEYFQTTKFLLLLSC